jgi:hypothetical protein
MTLRIWYRVRFARVAAALLGLAAREAASSLRGENPPPPGSAPR